MKKTELLKTEHQVQLKWLDNQMDKIANDGAKSFLNADVAERAYNQMLSESLITSENEIEHFVSTYLSGVGLKKLVTTLRVYIKRNGSERLQVEITRSNKTRLDRIVKLSGKTKIEIINQLIESVDLEEFEVIK
ncbi:hypothetical protein GCM10007916_01600 [Psychromonas marina]|uniref:Uncharacterized protein n=1 Tax=Psychromonas marina TaxID=88364 RepID=A0ABQ6DVQ4_9GAMM|nr:hypothetical protein [Psychromonas marina]GLS89093.1 hypothetical protein GCM10007916_01600 [Psychromonas marina]